MAKKTAKTAPETKWKVRARVPGLYGGHKQRNAEFYLRCAEDLARWMIPVGWTPETAKTAAKEE